MNETPARSRPWRRPLVGSLIQFVLAAALLVLGHWGPGLLLLVAGTALLGSALWTRGVFDGRRGTPGQ